MFKNADELLAFIKKEDVEFIDVRFCDLPGVMQHFNVPAATFDAESLTDGMMFDGSSIRGFQAIHESDMKLVARLRPRAYVDPFRKAKTLNMNFSIVDPFTDERTTATRATSRPRPRRTSRAPASPTPSFFGAEAEFYIFDDVRFETKQNAGYYYIDSIEGAWNTGREEEGGNKGYKTRYKGGYFPVAPVDHYSDLRDEMTTALTGRRPRGRARAPRGRHRRPGRDQLQVQHAAARG